MRTLFAALALSFAAPALAGPSLDAQVLLVEPDHSGQLPRELESMRGALASKGYTGASVTVRHAVHLEAGREVHVDLGRREVDLTLVSVQGGEARVRVQRGPQGAPKVTTVPTGQARFFVTAPRG